MSGNQQKYPGLDVQGREVLDDTPVAIPARVRNQTDWVRDVIRHELSRLADQQEYETFEEADDFICDDEEGELTSPYEEYFDPDTGESNFTRAITDGNNSATPPLSTGVAPPPRGGRCRRPRAAGRGSSCTVAT